MEKYKRSIGVFILLLLCCIICLLGVFIGVYYTFWGGEPFLLFPTLILLIIGGGFFASVYLSTIDRHVCIDSPQWETLIEAMQMSENAKLVLFRDRELELFRTTVHEDISNGDFHSALVLCDQMANVYGAVEEAEILRAKVQAIIHEHHEARIRDELAKLQQILDSQKWVEGYQYAAKLRRLFPDSPLLHGIEQQIADVRSTYRHNLEVRFLDAAKREDVLLAMKLLRELDGYLTPDEARRFRDTATSVITTYRETLGARFKLAVNDHQWHEALTIGMEITRQFPNTKMAEEVLVLLETIKTRAEEEESST